MNPVLRQLPPLEKLGNGRFLTRDLLLQLNAASRRLAECKGVAASIPNRQILISTLGLQEAKDSSAVENIVTTHDELFRDAVFPRTQHNPASKEVLRYGRAPDTGFRGVRGHGFTDIPCAIPPQSLATTAPAARRTP